MEIEKKIFSFTNKFQKTRIKSHTIQCLYFLGNQFLSVWFISLFFLIPCNLFENAKSSLRNIENRMLQVKEKQIQFFILIALSASAILSIVYAIMRTTNEMIIKYGFTILMIIKLVGCLVNTFLLMMIFNCQMGTLLKVASVVLFLLFEAIQLFADKFLISFSFESQNIFTHSNNEVITFAKQAERFILYGTFVSVLMFGEEIYLIKLYYPICIVLRVIQLVQYFQEKYFVDAVSNYLEIFGCIISMTVLFLTEIYELVSSELVRSNIYALWTIISIFAISSAYKYLNSKQIIFNFARNNSFFFVDIQEVIQKKQIFNYLEACYTLWKDSQSQYNSLIVASIKKNHQYACRKVKCFCKLAKLAEQNNNSVIQGNRVFFRGYFQDILDSIEKQTKNYDRVFLKALYFKFNVFKNYINITKEIQKINQYLLSNVQISIGKDLLLQNIAFYVKKLNSHNDNLNVQLPLILNNTINQFQRIIFSEIHIKSKKWSNLCKSLCKSLDIQEQIVKQISNLREFDRIYQQNKVTYEKSISFNAISLFYFGEIVFLGKQLQVIQGNLRQLKTIIKYNEVVSNKQLAKNIFDTRCGLIEFDLSKNQIMKNMELPISNCSNNVKSIFRTDKNHLIDEKINVLFPKFLWEVQKKLLIKYLNENQSTQNFQACDKYLVDRNGNVFQALVNLKMMPKSNGVSLMLIFFQKQSKNILLLNNKGIIQNVGQTFTTYFGKIHDGIPFSSFFYFENEYQSMKFTERTMRNKFILIDGAELGNDWSIYLQTIRSFLKKKILTESSRGTKSTKQNESPQPKKTQNQIIEEFLRKQKRQLIRSKILTSKTLKNLKQNESIRQKNVSLSILSATLNYKACEFEDFNYFSIVFDEIKRKKSPTAQTQYTIKSFKQVKNKKNGLTYDGTLKNLGNVDEEKVLLQQLENQEDQLDSIDIEEQLRRQQRQKQLIVHEASSVQSSLNASSVSYFYFKFIEICFDLFKNPNNVIDKRLNHFTFASTFMSLSISALILGTYIMFDLGLYEIKDIFFADGAVSDNMQLTEFMYNRAMNFKQFKQNGTQLQSIMKSAFYEREYLYSLTVGDLSNYMKQQTSMTKTKFYAYITFPVVWKFINPASPALQIQTNQLLTYYYQLSREVQLNILNQTEQAGQIVENALQLMKLNFPEMKRINHENLWIYQRMSDDSLLLLRQLTIILGFTHAFLTLMLFFAYYKQKIFRRNQMIEGYSIYKLIPQKIIEVISSYYDIYVRQIKRQKDLIKYESHYDRHFLYLPQDQAASRPNRNIFMTSYSFFTPSIWKMLAVVTFLNLMFVFTIFKVKNLFDPIELMMRNVNNLMDSQNYLLQAYFDLKAKFVIQENYNVNPDFFDEILETQRNIEVVFNKISVESLDLFTNYDPAYKPQFIQLLINDTCQLAKQQIQVEQYQKCIQYFKLDFLHNGVITGMNFFTRRTRHLIDQFKLKFSYKPGKTEHELKNDKEYVKMTLNSLDFRELDESIIFMFKMYQATQSRIYGSLEIAIIDVMHFTFWIVLLQILIVGVAYPVLLYFNYKWQKQQLSQIYVSFLLIPSPLAKLLKSFSGRIQKILEYQKAK